MLIGEQIQSAFFFAEKKINPSNLSLQRRTTISVSQTKGKQTVFFEEKNKTQATFHCKEAPLSVLVKQQNNQFFFYEIPFYFKQYHSFELTKIIPIRFKNTLQI